jgi:hypothetical protein
MGGKDPLPSATGTNLKKEELMKEGDHPLM